MYKKVSPGMRFGFLVVAKPSDKPRSKTGGAYWDCMCDCGGFKAVTTTSLYKVKIPACATHKTKHIRVGDRFGLLVVLSRGRTTNTRGADGRYWNCVCDCGTTREATARGLERGSANSCGCLAHQDRGGLIKRYPRTVTSWNQMLRRCLQKSNEEYQNYGGRGITVCDRWRSFSNFLADMGERPEGKTIDRKDNDKGYYKENCRWATPREQTLNRRATRFIEIDGERLCLTDWAMRLGIHQTTMYQAATKSGRSVEDICRDRVSARGVGT